jgi:hypothetical protein
VGFSVYGYPNIGLVGTRLTNAFSPNLARAVSDYDLTHQMNANWIADLPVGKPSERNVRVDPIQMRP